MNILILVYLAKLLIADEPLAIGAINNGAIPVVDSPLIPAGSPVEKRKTTIVFTYLATPYSDEEGYEDDDGVCGHNGGDCHDQNHPHRPPRTTTDTVFILPSVETIFKTDTLTTIIPVPIPYPTKPNSCDSGANCPRPCSSSRPTGNACSGGSGGNIIGTSTLPLTSKAPNTSVLILSTATRSVTIYTQSEPMTNDAHAANMPGAFTASLAIAICILMIIL